MSRGLVRRLERLEIASTRGRAGIVEVERSAQLLMAILAQELAEHKGLDPVTDRVDLLARAQRIVGQGDQQLSLRIQRAREGLLAVSVPSPTRVQPVEEILRFKEQNAALMRRFRERIEDEALSIAKEGSGEVREALQRRAEQRLADEIDEIEERMQESRWKVNRTGAIISIATPVFPTETLERLSPELAFAVHARRRSQVVSHAANR